MQKKFNIIFLKTQFRTQWATIAYNNDDVHDNNETEIAFTYTRTQTPFFRLDGNTMRKNSRLFKIFDKKQQQYKLLNPFYYTVHLLMFVKSLNGLRK